MMQAVYPLVTNAEGQITVNQKVFGTRSEDKHIQVWWF
jgi:hypothetical protein